MLKKVSVNCSRLKSNSWSHRWSSWLRMMEDKVQGSIEWPAPTKATEVRSFLGTVGYYRKFIKNFSGIAAPLTELTKDTVKFDWSQQA